MGLGGVWRLAPCGTSAAAEAMRTAIVSKQVRKRDEQFQVLVCKFAEPGDPSI
jgi:hypothetical protein